MTAQTAIAQPASGSHYGVIGAVVLAVALLVVGLTFVFELLLSTTQPVSESAPIFNAPAFRAEERNFVIIPTFDAPAFRAEEHEPIN